MKNNNTRARAGPVRITVGGNGPHYGMIKGGDISGVTTGSFNG